MAETTYYSALHYAKKAEKSAKEAAESAASIVDVSGKIIQLGFDGSIDNNVLVFNHAPGGVDAPYALVDDYEYEIDLVYANTSNLPNDTQMVIKNGSDTINFVSAVHRSSTEPATVGDMKAVMRFDSSTGYRWLFKAAFKITTSGAKVFLLYPVVYNDEDVKALQAADAQNVKLTGNQTIGGGKTFAGTSPIRLSRNGATYTEVMTTSNGTTRTGGFRNISDNHNTTLMYVTSDDGTQIKGNIGIVFDGTNVYTQAPTPPTTDNSVKIATTAFFRNNMQVVTSLPSSPTAGVFYFVKE